MAKQKITEWVSGGNYVVAVNVDARILPERPDEPFLEPATVRFLENVAREARAGNLEELKRVGKVYVALDPVDATVGTGF